MEQEATFGHVLRRIRDAQDISQETLAFESGVSRSFLARLETGLQQPTLRTVFKLAHGLGMSASALIAEVERELKAPEKGPN